MPQLSSPDDLRLLGHQEGLFLRCFPSLLEDQVCQGYHHYLVGPTRVDKRNKHIVIQSLIWSKVSAGSVGQTLYLITTFLNVLALAQKF